jgi:pyridinium-3,5-biscarboxylic acid mononucleotide sulfurtransferase
MAQPANHSKRQLTIDDLDPALVLKWQDLLEILSKFPSAAVAYSGGVDSALLSTAAYLVLGNRMAAYTIRSLVESPGDSLAASEIANLVGFRHIFVDFDDLAQAAFRDNPPDRCYYCKLKRFKTMGGLAAQEGLGILLEGSNVDDQGQRRPGRRAQIELGVKSPLAEAGLRKVEIRGLAHSLGLPVWDRPSSPCLATRFPYGMSINREGLERVAAAEAVLQDCGFSLVRVRDYGHMARIEVDPEMIEHLCTKRNDLTKQLLNLGYKHIALDLIGYRSGSLDEVLGI